MQLGPSPMSLLNWPGKSKGRRRPKRRFKINFPLDDNCCVGEQTNDDDAVARRGNDGGEARKTGAGGLAGRIGQP